MRSKLVVGFILAVVAIMLIASGAMAAKLLCVSNKTLKGQDTVESCLAKGEKFAVVDDYGLVRILSPEELGPLDLSTRPKLLRLLLCPGFPNPKVLCSTVNTRSAKTLRIYKSPQT
jgi:hypothetical protein